MTLGPRVALGETRTPLEGPYCGPRALKRPYSGAASEAF